jgi:phage terminase large subunit GpA-like protein
MGAEKGPYRLRRTPYIRGPLDAAGDCRWRIVGMICGTQMAKTTGLALNVIGHRLDDDPCPVLIVFPTRNAGESQFEPKLMSMLRNTPSLWAKTAQGKQQRRTHKRINGVDVRIGWAGSAVEMASMEAGIVYLDELDRMPNVPGEGDPVEVAQGRLAQFPDGLALVSASPTLGTVEVYVDDQGYERWRVAAPQDVQSRVWKLWQESTRHEFMIPCPDCGAFFSPRLRHVKWPEGASVAQIRRAARLECRVCQHPIDEREKLAALDRGLHVAPGQIVVDGCVEGEAPESESWMTWVSGLCSPWRSIGSIAGAWAGAARSRDPSRIQAVLNVRIGELYSIAGQALPWEKVRDRLTADYQMGEVPSGVELVIVTVDVQGTRLVYEVRGWGVRLQSWLLECGELWGDPKLPQVWKDLEGILSHTYGERPVRLTLVDSGYFPDPVYAFVKKHPTLVRATKGASHDMQGRRYKANVTDVAGRTGKAKASGARLWSINTVLNKDFIWGKMDVDSDAPSGFYVPIDVPERYMLELTAEARLESPSGKVYYKKVRTQNHSFDTATLQVAGAYMLGVDHLVDGRPPPPRPPVGPPPAGAPGADRSPRPSVQPAGGWNVAFRAGG